MSHTVRNKVLFTNLDALIAAGEKCGLVFHKDQKTARFYHRGYVGDSPMPEGFTWHTTRPGVRYPHVHDPSKRMLGTCDHAFSVKGMCGAYELGVIQNPDGTYFLWHDHYMGGMGLSECIGTQWGKTDLLEAEYARQLVSIVAQQQGWTVEHQGTDTLIHIWDDATQSMGTITMSQDAVLDANGFTGVGCQGPIQKLSNALGSPTETTIKPEFWLTNQSTYQGGN